MEHMACIDWLRQPTLIKDRNRTLKTERNKISRNKSFEEFKLWKGAAAKGSATTIAYTIRNLKFLTVFICYFQGGVELMLVFILFLPPIWKITGCIVKVIELQ